MKWVIDLISAVSLRTELKWAVCDWFNPPMTRKVKLNVFLVLFFFFNFCHILLQRLILTSKTCKNKPQHCWCSSVSPSPSVSQACAIFPVSFFFSMHFFSDLLQSLQHAWVLVWHVKNATAVQLSVRTAYLMPTFLSRQWSPHTHTHTLAGGCFHQNSSAFQSNAWCATLRFCSDDLRSTCLQLSLLCPLINRS